jgi:ElaB/YqjD/DUF883 family membrane-anchored ribosome-binding protein
MAVKDTEMGGSETLRAEIDQLRADMAAIARTLKDLGTEEGSRVYERLRHSAERVRGEAEHAADSVTRRIEEKPLSAVILAFVVGAILGALIGRR